MKLILKVVSVDEWGHAVVDVRIDHPDGERKVGGLNVEPAEFNRIVAALSFGMDRGEFEHDDRVLRDWVRSRNA